MAYYIAEGVALVGLAVTSEATEEAEWWKRDAREEKSWWMRDSIELMMLAALPDGVGNVNSECVKE